MYTCENTKTREEAINLMTGAYDIATSHCPTIELDGKTWCYTPVTGWYNMTNEYETPPNGIDDMLFDKLKMWMATQLDIINSL